ncbi:MAG: hypothetical protein R6V76_13835 [Desulfobacterales bacterium]
MEKIKNVDKKFNYLLGLLNIVVVFGIVWVLWYIFMNPSAVLKLYTPMYGFALVVTLVAAILIIADIADFYPFPARNTSQSLVGRGVFLTVTAVVLMLLIFYVVFWGFIGKFGVAYFSPQSIIASGGIGAEFFVARENACTAIVYFLTAFIWMTLFWRSGFGNWPWQGAERGTAAWSRFFAVFFFSTIIFSILFHPHVCSLFYPAQTKAGVAPWWDEFAGTGSAFFSLGLVLCIIFWLISFDFLWEGQPFKQIGREGDGNFWKGIVVFIASVLLGILLVYILTRIMNSIWNEPFVGGQYTDGPDFRYIHTGEIAGFFILAAFILKYYFNNFPNVGGIWVRGVVRTVIAIAGGMLFYAFYYSSLATLVLAKVPGFAQPGDTPLVWIFLFLSVIIIQMDFFEGWPLSRRSEK